MKRLQFFDLLIRSVKQNAKFNLRSFILLHSVEILCLYLPGVSNQSLFRALCINVRSEQVCVILPHQPALPSEDLRYQHPNHTQINMYYSALPLVVAGFPA